MNQDAQATQEQSGKGLRFLLAFLFKFLIPVLILGAALGFTKHQMDTRPAARRMKPPRQARVVKVMRAETGAVPVVVQSRGNVVPAQSVTVSPEVAGRVVAMHPDLMPGGVVQTGQELIKIDARDYEYALEQRRSEQARAELNLKLEQGSQVIARREYEMLQDQVSEQERELVLREPYLASSEAALRAAQSSVDKAQLDVDRCRVTAPFNGIIQTRNTELGAQVTPATRLLTLTGTDVYWVEAKVKVDDLKWIQFPQETGQLGSTVRVYDEAAWGQGVFREGRVSRLLPDVVSQGRMAKVLVVIEDPLALTPTHTGEAPLLLNAYVRMEIQGKSVANAITLPRSVLRDEALWVMTDANQLDIRSVAIAHKGADTVLVTGGVTPGERIVTTNIAAPIDGMALELDTKLAGQPESESYARSGTHD